ncbi:hypothetical protein TNCV_3873001 [Trichonephila clavipes]|nr:hypothetical protein TNCV_3873001 [Trichonephila clavipes]
MLLFFNNTFAQLLASFFLRKLQKAPCIHARRKRKTVCWNWRDEIFRINVASNEEAIGDDFMSIHEKCRSHHANLVDDFFLERNHTNGMTGKFSRHEPNKACLEYTTQTKFWTPTITKNSPRAGKGSFGGE